MTLSFTSFRPCSIFTAIAIQAVYCKHRQERKGNKKAELAITSSTSMHRREPKSWGRQTKKQKLLGLSHTANLAQMPQSWDYSNQDEIGSNDSLKFTTLSAFALYLSIAMWIMLIFITVGPRYSRPLCVQRINLFANMENEKRDLWSSSLKHIC